MTGITYKQVKWLAIFTIGYNILEGLVSVMLGASDETLALFGFGIDSFIEVLSGIGILQMVIRINQNIDESRSRFEITALRITGWGFYLLTIGLIVGSVVNLVRGHKPETTFWGIVISAISIIVMTVLYRMKMVCGRSLGSEPVTADAKCTLVCIYMSLILLLSSAVYELTGFGWVDTLGALGLAWYSFKEGKEAFEKAAIKRVNSER